MVKAEDENRVGRFGQIGTPQTVLSATGSAHMLSRVKFENQGVIPNLILLVRRRLLIDVTYHLPKI